MAALALSVVASKRDLRLENLRQRKRKSSVSFCLAIASMLAIVAFRGDLRLKELRQRKRKSLVSLCRWSLS